MRQLAEVRKMRNYNYNQIVKMTFQFALNVIAYSEVLREEKRYALADQILRAGCFVGVNVKEAQGAESRADFIHNMKVAIKEAEEIEYWLELCDFSKDLPKPGKLLGDMKAY